MAETLDSLDSLAGRVAAPDERVELDTLDLPAVPGWREAWSELRARLPVSTPRLMAALGVLVVLVSVVVGSRWFASTPNGPELSLPMATSPGSVATVTTVVEEVVVDIGGAVARPGVYRMPAGSRVTDLIAAAGGLVSGADTDRVNLAALLVDGQKIYVPMEGEIGVPVDSSAASGSQSAGPTPEQPLDLNTASVEELDLLPGIGPTTAAAIVQYRDEHGPFRSVDQLLDVNGIGEAKLEQIRELVRV